MNLESYVLFPITKNYVRLYPLRKQVLATRYNTKYHFTIQYLSESRLNKGVFPNPMTLHL